MKLQKALLAGFIVGALLGFGLCNVGVVPWESDLVAAIGVYLSLSGAYLAAFPIILLDILTSKGRWAHPRIRTIGVPLVGASLGLLVLGWIALLCPFDLEGVRSKQFEGLLCGHGPQAIWTQARELMPRAELLAFCKTLIDESAEFAAAFAAAAMICIAIYDRTKPRWPITSFFVGTLLPMSIYLAILLESHRFRNLGPPGVPMQDVTFNILLASCFCGALLTAIVWTVRKGCWSPKGPPTLVRSISDQEC